MKLRERRLIGGPGRMAGKEDDILTFGIHQDVGMIMISLATKRAERDILFLGRAQVCAKIRYSQSPLASYANKL